MTTDPGAPLDGGVLQRLRRRHLIIGGLLTAAAVGGLTIGILTADSDRLLGFGVVVVVVLGVLALAGFFFRAAGMWARAARLPSVSTGSRGLVGRCRPLHTVRPRQPVKRRYPTTVIAIRTVDGPLAGGGGLLVHGRRDQVALAEDDAVLVWSLRAAPPAVDLGKHTSPATTAGTDTPAGGKAPTGNFLIVRESDGAVFAAGTNPLSAL